METHPRFQQGCDVRRDVFLHMLCARVPLIVSKKGAVRYLNIPTVRGFSQVPETILSCGMGTGTKYKCSHSALLKSPPSRRGLYFVHRDMAVQTMTSGLQSDNSPQPKASRATLPDKRAHSPTPSTCEISGGRVKCEVRIQHPATSNCAISILCPDRTMDVGCTQEKPPGWTAPLGSPPSGQLPIH